jgi:hypothetical protein
MKNMVRSQPLRGAGTFAAVSMVSVKRLVCHFLIVWLALLSGGAHAHATADAAQEVGHIAAHALEAQLAAADGADAVIAAHDHAHSETCSLSHCGHGHVTGLLSGGEFRFSAPNRGAPLPTPASWASREQPDSIERPKWRFTTPAVVNL